MKYDNTVWERGRPRLKPSRRTVNTSGELGRMSATGSEDHGEPWEHFRELRSKIRLHFQKFIPWERLQVNGKGDFNHPNGRLTRVTQGNLCSFPDTQPCFYHSVLVWRTHTPGCFSCCSSLHRSSPGLVMFVHQNQCWALQFSMESFPGLYPAPP